MAVFRFIVSGKIRAGDEEDARFYIGDSMRPGDLPYDPIEGDISVQVMEIEEE